jgi:hypothetical protein
MEKKQILQLIEQKLESNIVELTQALESYAEAANLDEGDTIDPEDFSRQTDSREMTMRMQLQLDQAQTQLAQLHELSGKHTHSVEVGALVETAKYWLYIGISFSAMQTDGKELIGISSESPLFITIHGMHVGEKFLLGKEEHEILHIY